MQKGSAVLWVLAIIGLLIFSGMVSVNTQQKSIVGTGKTETGKTEIVIAGQECGSDGTADLAVRVENKNNGTLSYVASVVSYVKDRKVKGSVTGNAGGSGTTLASSTEILGCKETYELYQLDSSTITSAKYGSITPISDLNELDLIGSASDQVNFNMWTLGYGNETSGVNVQDAATLNSIALTTSATTIRFDVGLASGTAQFGALEAYYDPDTKEIASAYVCAFINTTEMASTDINVNYPGIKKQLNENNLPKWCKNNAPAGTQAKAAWVVDPIVGSAGRQSGTVSMTCSLVECTAAEDIRIQWVDAVFHRDSDGNVAFGTAGPANEDLGETNRYFAINKA